ncbi:MAG TPA: DJ-1/PfpI family protein [Candidatus Aquicultor sp.]|jgi:putative intracellular protease/amidase
MADMMGRQVLFLAVDGFDASAFLPLWQCFGNLNASLRIVSFNASDVINSMDGSVSTKSDMSFNEASVLGFSAIVVPDAKTAQSIMDNSDAMTILKNARDDNVPIIAIGDAATALLAADIVNGLTVSAPDNMRDNVESVGAQFSSEPISASENVFTALESADMQALCKMVSDYATMQSENAA